MKNYGFDFVLEPIVKDLKELERDGLHISTAVFEGKVHIGLAQFTGDNLGVNGICGFVECLTSNHFCRHCKMHVQGMRHTLTEKADLQRNYENFAADLAQNNPTSTGIKGPRLLNDIEHFHVTINYAPDVMHDLLEGVCGLEII